MLDKNKIIKNLINCFKIFIGYNFFNFLFGGKINLGNQCITKRTKITKITLIKSLAIEVNFPELVFFVNCI